jgi:hypothetical protein
MTVSLFEAVIRRSALLKWGGAITVRWVHKVTPWLAVISLIGNIYFVQLLWKSETHANHYLWGNMTNYVIAGVTWADTGSDPNAQVALAALDLLRSLPRSEQRVGADQLQMVEDFLRRASAVRAKAAEERRESGGYSAETARQLQQVQTGFTCLLENLERVNELEKDKYALNDRAWRSMWTDIATGLQKISLP